MRSKKEKSIFPSRTLSNPDRRQEKLSENLNAAPNKKYQMRQSSVRITRGEIEPDVWLRNQYTNETEHMICQICKDMMPFKKSNGDYYFEAVEAFTKDHFPKEYEAQFLALCPLCAARYKEFIKRDEDAIKKLKNELVNSTEPEIPLQLGELVTSIQFVEIHYHDIKTILEEENVT